jgi:hypothetical protein
MRPIDRRTFLSGLTSSLVVSAMGFPTLAHAGPTQQYPPAPRSDAPLPPGSCWLDICAPFVVEDPALGIHSELLLTAACFPGVDGFRDPQFATEYEVELFDPEGKKIPLNAERLLVPAMRPTVLPMRDVARREQFWGSARIRLIPRGRNVTRAGDLFSAGFMRWKSGDNLDNVHAHPASNDTLRGRHHYSMPIPPLEEYHCAFVLFNPEDAESAGVVRIVDFFGRTVGETPYKLRPRQTVAYSLADLTIADSPAAALAPGAVPEKGLRKGGVVVVTNRTETLTFANTMMRGRNGSALSVEHPLHFIDRPVKPARKDPYGPNRSFPAEALLYTPMLFNSTRIGGLELDSRLYMSSSRWQEEVLWVMPFVTNAEGMIAWVSNQDDAFPGRVLPTEVCEKGLLRLTEFQSCRIDAAKLPLPPGFSGGYGLATIPRTAHALMKVEVRARPWGRVAFTHFRPGGQFHRRYREVTERGGLATDYIISGMQVRGRGDARRRDTLLAVMNIEFADERTGAPKLQIFGQKGLVAEKQLADLPPLACRHYLLSELFPDVETEPGSPLTIRMLDANTMVVASALHLDYERRDLALEHGSDRHSTFNDFKC